MLKDSGNGETKLQAMSYVFLCILQRLDEAQPGLIADVLGGVRADREASLAQSPAALPIFDEAIKFLERANQQNGT
ncbi:hypothetical protein [Brytella acorum]|uniref:Uncharacterized protein n=1 Tax=Brytella acorum TaxID=2959299 RepID=A0AA35UQY2_9PROT|nr:hypothetical protein [Brytella acorum]MDF3623393.1 hypothetical protein [Brytella acorum]CAI9120500.1 hypothetical protein LMG32879_001333 [Brytella acorum]